MEKDRTTSSESARTEHCPNCDSTSTKNNMYFCKGEKIRVYIECAECGEFVARYTLSAYTSDKSYESLLRRLRFTRINSGKRAKNMVECFEDNVKTEFDHVLSLIKQNEDERMIENIIEEDFPE
ncbi:MAG: hypothetical protein KAV42_05840 [Candidatus Krumholzibacteria bacterium]|nr:hypothetical protein [Candidatus Krumholzibacteria bacterium]